MQIMTLALGLTGSAR